MPNVNFGFHSDSGAEASSLPEVITQAEDILEISEAAALPQQSEPVELDDVILLPCPELGGTPVEDETLAVRIDDSQQTESEPVMEGARRSFIKSDPGPGSRAQGVAVLDQTLSPKEQPFNEAEELKGVRLISFSASRLLAVAGAFVLFIVLAEILTGNSDKASVRAETSHPTAPAATSPITPAPTPAPPVQTPVADMPTRAPMASENKPLETKVAADPAPTTTPSVTATAGQPDHNEKGTLTIQVGSHKDPGAANFQAEKLRAAGFEPRVVSAEIPNRGTWYRVQVGKFSSRDEANRMGAQIVAKGAAENFVLSGL